MTFFPIKTTLPKALKRPSETKKPHRNTQKFTIFFSIPNLTTPSISNSQKTEKNYEILTKGFNINRIETSTSILWLEGCANSFFISFVGGMYVLGVGEAVWVSVEIEFVYSGWSLFITGELIQSCYSVQFILRFDLKCMTNITSIYLKIIYKINSEDFFNTIVVNQIVDKYRTSRFILFFLFFYDEGTYSRY